MKLSIYIALAAGLGACAAAAVVLCRRLQKQKPLDIVEEASPMPEETPEEVFSREWAAVLAQDAPVFNGLYTSLRRIETGNAKKPEKILREWCQRTHYKWEDSPVDQLCRQYLLPLLEAGDRDSLEKWAVCLLGAASAAGITRETAESLILTEASVRDYAEWDGLELYPDDEVAILTPAWYQNGTLLEQGMCRKADTASSS